MIFISRARLRISWLRVRSSASGSRVTVDFTNVSGIVCRSTMIRAFAVHRLGRKMASEAPAVRTNRNGSRESTHRRRATSKIFATMPRPGSDMLVTMRASGDDDHVAGLQDEVRLVAAVRDRTVVVEADPLGLAVVVVTDDRDLARRGEVLEAAGHGERLEDGRLTAQLEHAGLDDLTEDRHAHAAHFVH